jgi:hypothetical protein
MVAASAARLVITPGGNGIIAEDGPQIVSEEFLGIASEDPQSLVSRVPNVRVRTANIVILPSGSGIFAEDGKVVVTEDAQPIIPEVPARATVASSGSTDVDVIVGAAGLALATHRAAISTGSGLSTDSFSEETDAWTISTPNSGGAIVWAIVSVGGATPSPDGAGGWTGTVVNSGSVAFSTTLEIDAGGTPGTSYDFYLYQRISGTDSNVIVQRYTPNIEVSAAGLVITTYRASLVPNNIDANTESLVLATQPATVRIDVNVPVDAASLQITTNPATISAGFNVFADAASLVITPRAASVALVGSINAATANLVLTTYPASITGVSVPNAVTAENSRLGGRLVSSVRSGSLGRHKLQGKVTYG